MKKSFKKVDIQQEITDRIIEDLNKGVLPWSRPWAVKTPMNFANKKAYRGINVLVLMDEAARRDYKSNFWLTYKQATDLGGKIRPGEHGVHVVFNQPFTKETENKDGEKKQRKLWFMRYYTVFNISQTEGLDEKIIEELNDPAKAEEIPDANQVIKDTGAKITFGGDKACYMPTLDEILMPPQPKFTSTIGYYATMFHELVHWTGHDSRLEREIMNQFGSEKYAEEELVAEMGAAFICGALGMPYETNHAAYVKSWLKVLKDDKRAIFTAAGKAQKAMDLILKTEVNMIEGTVVKGDEPLPKKRRKNKKLDAQETS